MNKKKLVIVVFVLLIALLLPAAASAATSIKSSGKTAHAGLDGYDSSGCIYTDIFVIPSENISKDGGTPSSGASIFVRLFRYDICSDEPLISGIAVTQLDPSTFTIDSQLQSGQLNTTIEFFNEVTSSPLNLDINLTWTGVGGLFSGVRKFKHTSLDCRISGRSSGTSRLAQVSGSVSDGTTNFISGLEHPYSVDLESIKESTVTIGC